jgi:hypothetical protein
MKMEPGESPTKAGKIQELRRVSPDSLDSEAQAEHHCQPISLGSRNIM